LAIRQQTVLGKAVCIAAGSGRVGPAGPTLLLLLRLPLLVKKLAALLLGVAARGRMRAVRSPQSHHQQHQHQHQLMLTLTPMPTLMPLMLMPVLMLPQQLLISSCRMSSPRWALSSPPQASTAQHFYRASTSQLSTHSSP
jgi:hypothetical protein